MSTHVPNKKVVVVLPAYHAINTLKRTIDAIPRDWVDETILVDDASRDGTAEFARSLGIKTVEHAKNRGYGGNQKTCYATAQNLGADVVVMVHPDFQYDPYYIPDLIRPIIEGRADAVFGSRMMIPGGARAGGMPMWKFVANIALSALGNLVLGLRLSEYHSGLRAYSREVLERAPIELNSDNFVFDTEIIAQLRIFSFRILEMPIATCYFPEASMIGFWRSCQYGLSFLFVLCQYLLHQGGIARQDKFLPVFSSQTKICPGCGQGKRLVQVYYERTGRVKKYRITDTGIGHGEIVRCLYCGLIFEPREKGKDKVDYAEQELDQEYLDEERGRNKTGRRALSVLCQLLPTKGDLLEFGAGPGFFVTLARQAGFRARGIEIGQAWCQYAAKRGEKNIDCGGLDLLAETRDASVDAIVLWDVLEHVADPITLLNLSHSKLKVGGVLALSVPRWDSLARRVMEEHWHALVPGHLTYFGSSTLTHYLEKSGFKVVLARSYRRHFSVRSFFNRLFGLKRGKLFRSIIIPVNLFDELEVYCIKE